MASRCMNAFLNTRDMALKGRNFSMKKKKIIFFSIMVLSIIFLCYLSISCRNEEEASIKTEPSENLYNTTVESITESEHEKDITKIKELKEENGLYADDNLYQIDREYDGREVLNINRNIQYKVALAGIVKKEIPKLSEINETFKKYNPVNNGIWVEEKSRNKVLELLKKNTNSKYLINEDGYLVIEKKENQNENDKIIEKAINSSKKIIFTISDFYYEVDNISGEVVSYPFEILDNYQAYDKVECEGGIIIIITTNTNKKLTNSEIIKEILQMLREDLL